MSAAPVSARPEHPAPAAQAPGVVYDGRFRFAVRSATARVQRRALDISPGDLLVYLLVDAAPFAALRSDGVSMSDVVSLADDADVVLEELATERALRRLARAGLLDRARRSGRNGEARYLPVEKPHDWRRIPVVWASSDPKALRALIACAFAKTGRDWETWLAGDRYELVVNGHRALRSLKVWLRGKRVPMTDRRFAAAIANAPFRIQIVDQKPSERASKNGRPTVQEWSSDAASTCARSTSPGLDLALDRRATAKTDCTQNAAAPPSETASVAPRVETETTDTHRPDRPPMAQRPTPAPIPPRIAALIAERGWTAAAAAFVGVTGEELDRRAALLARAAADSALTNPAAWFRWAVGSAADRDCAGWWQAGRELLVETVSLTCPRCYGRTVRELKPGRWAGDCDRCRHAHDLTRDAAGWHWTMADVTVRPTRADDPAPIPLDGWGDRQIAALDPDARADYEAWRAEAKRRTAEFMAAGAAAETKRNAASWRRPTPSAPPIPTPQPAADPDAYDPFEAPALGGSEPEPTPEPGPDERQAAIARLMATPEGRARLLAAMRLGSAEKLIEREMSA